MVYEDQPGRHAKFDRPQGWRMEMFLSQHANLLRGDTQVGDNRQNCLDAD